MGRELGLDRRAKYAPTPVVVQTHGENRGLSLGQADAVAEDIDPVRMRLEIRSGHARAGHEGFREQIVRVWSGSRRSDQAGDALPVDSVCHRSRDDNTDISYQSFPEYGT